MTYELLRSERASRGWTQVEAANRLGVSQPYLAMLERGKRRVTSTLAKRARDVYGLSPTVVPPTNVPVYRGDPADALARDLAALGYPGLSYLRPSPWEVKNPAEVLLAALVQDDLEPRLVEALPWLALRYSPFDNRWLVREAKLRDLQNRLGFVVTLARRLAERFDHEKVQMLQTLEAQLDHSRLAREDTLCKRVVREPLRRWLTEHRPDDARHWNLLTDWSVDVLRYSV